MLEAILRVQEQCYAFVGNTMRSRAMLCVYGQYHAFKSSAMHLWAILCVGGLRLCVGEVEKRCYALVNSFIKGKMSSG